MQAELFRSAGGEKILALFGMFQLINGDHMKSTIVVNMIAAAGLMVAGNALALDMPDVAKKNNCAACHSVEKKVVGPAWMDVSKKYKDLAKYTYDSKEYPIREGLALKVSKGGKGNWGVQPMPGYPKVSDAEMKELLDFILGLAK